MRIAELISDEKLAALGAVREEAEKSLRKKQIKEQEREAARKRSLAGRNGIPKLR